MSGSHFANGRRLSVKTVLISIRKVSFKINSRALDAEITGGLDALLKYLVA